MCRITICNNFNYCHFKSYINCDINSNFLKNVSNGLLREIKSNETQFGIKFDYNFKSTNKFLRYYIQFIRWRQNGIRAFFVFIQELDNFCVSFLHFLVLLLGKVEDQKSFDTHEDYKNAEAMLDYVQGLSDRYISLFYKSKSHLLR